MYDKDLNKFIELFSSFTGVRTSKLEAFLKNNNVSELLSRPTDVTTNLKSIEAIQNLTLMRNIFDNLKSYDREYKLSDPEAAASFFKNNFNDIRHREFFTVAYLDTKNRVIDFEVVSTGSVNAAQVHPREILKSAMLKNAASLILGHNHPSGIPKPSHEDISITVRLVEAAKIIGISIVDHVIVGANNHHSMLENGDVSFSSSMSPISSAASAFREDDASYEYGSLKSNSMNIKLLYEMIGFKLNDKLCFTTFEMLENEFEKGDLFKNIEAFSNLTDEEKESFAEDFEVNFKQYQDDYEWDEFYRQNEEVYIQITEIIDFEHTDINVDGHAGRWHSIMQVPNRWNNEFVKGDPLYLVQHDSLDKPYAIINEDLRVVLHEAPNGFKDLDQEQELSFDDDEIVMD